MRATRSKRFQVIPILAVSCGPIFFTGCGTGAYEKRMENETISALQAGEEPPGAVNKAPEEAGNTISSEEFQARLRAAQAAAAAPAQAQPDANGEAAPAAQAPAAPQ